MRNLQRWKICSTLFWMYLPIWWNSTATTAVSSHRDAPSVLELWLLRGSSSCGAALLASLRRPRPILGCDSPAWTPPSPGWKDHRGSPSLPKTPIKLPNGFGESCSGGKAKGERLRKTLSPLPYFVHMAHSSLPLLYGLHNPPSLFSYLKKWHTFHCTIIIGAHIGLSH